MAHSALTPGHVAPAPLPRARAGLVVFFTILLPLTLLGYWLWIGQGNHYALIFAPAVAAIVTPVTP